MPELSVYKLPEEFSIPFVAAFRMLEMTINPVFSFPFKCNNCGRLSEAQGNQGPAFVHSNKKKKGTTIIIGIQCQTEDCGMVIKFMRPFSMSDKDWPERLTSVPETVLEDPKGKTGAKVSTKGLEEFESMLEIE